jgi:hypothetical protein
MKTILSFLALSSLFLVSCREERASADHSRESAESLSALETRLSQLEREVLREKNDRLQQEAVQKETLGEIRELVSRQNDLLEKLSREKNSQATAVLKAEPLKIDQSGQSREEKLETEEKNLRLREKVRAEAQGETYVSLKTLSGEEFFDLVITQVNDIGVVFRHRLGIARIPFSELPAAWGDRFYHDPARAQIALEKERIFKARRDREVEKQLAEERERAEEEAVNQQLAQLAQAVDDLRRRSGSQPTQIWANNGVLGNGFFGTVPFVANGQFGCWDWLFCPPVIQAPVIRPPVIRSYPQAQSSLVRDQVGSSLGTVPSLRRPSISQPKPGRIPGSSPTVLPRPTLQRPPSRTSGGSPVVSRPRVTRPTTGPRVIRPSTSSRSSTRTVRPSSSVRSIPRSSGGVIRRSK